MCGIAGIVRHDGGPVAAELLEAMTSSLVHRGPDQHGYHYDAGVGLGHRRLSIIDLSAGRQPMLTADGRTALTFNGEIYNYRALRQELQARGHRFEQESDTEVLLHAWLEWRQDCVSHLRGMFAFAVWDAAEQLLFIGRDRLGIKPVYYGHTNDGCFIFGSELKALTTHPRFEQQIDPLAVEDYFAFGYIPEPRSIYTAARKLPAGHTLTLRRGQAEPQISRYWDIPFAGDVPATEAGIGAELIERLREAVDIRLVADVPLGAFLSGGVDSSAVVSLMAETSPSQVRTFSIAFDVPEYDESSYARLMAGHCHTAHTEKLVQVDDFDLLDQLGGIYDEPYADSSALPTYRLCQLAREHVTVALSGDGGDENFAGYWRYREFLRTQQISARLPGFVQSALAGPMASLIPGTGTSILAGRIRDKLEFWGRDPLANYMHSISVVKERDRRAMFSESMQRSLGGYRAAEVLAQHRSNSPVQEGLPLIQYLDFKTYLVDDILTKVDRASMAHSLEVRVPVLDHKFVEWASAVPVDMKMTINGEGKHIFKKSLEQRLPHDVLYRKKKGFSVPLSRWFQGALRERVRRMLNSEAMRDSGLFAEPYLRAMQSRLDRGWYECSPQLWSMLMFEAFLRATR